MQWSKTIRRLWKLNSAAIVFFFFFLEDEETQESIQGRKRKERKTIITFKGA